jgi:hypothetical protein
MRKGYRKLFLVFFLTAKMGAGGSHLEAATRVFRCVDEAGKVEFRQGRCAAGEEQALSIESPRVGWIKPRSGAVSDNNRKAKPAGPAGKQDLQSTGEAADRRRCWEGRQQLKRIQWRRRKGYDFAEGEEMRQERRQEEAFQREFCRE